MREEPRLSGSIIASGGLRRGQDLAKAIALGAEIGALALPFIKDVFEGGAERVAQRIRLLGRVLRSVMLLTGSRTVDDLRRAPVILDTGAHGDRLAGLRLRRGVNAAMHAAEQRFAERRFAEHSFAEHGFAEHKAAVARWEPAVRALVGWDAEAARHRADAACGGPLAGWAIGVKDILDLAGTPTACGVDFLPPEPKTTSARIVEQLQEQGAYALAKTVTTCFAYLDPGPTRNPWNREHTPGGSSMGSAAAVATGMVRAAIGTQTVGSVCRPASFCGVVGFKPSYGLVSTDGCFALVPTFDTIGFFTRDVEDMTALWDAVAPLPARARGPWRAARGRRPRGYSVASRSTRR